jgi:hypothetical protein
MGEAKRRKQLDKGFGTTTAIKEVLVFPVFRSVLNQSFEDEIREKMEAKSSDNEVLFVARGAKGEPMRGFATILKSWVEVNISPEAANLFLFPQDSFENYDPSEPQDAVLVLERIKSIESAHKQKRKPKIVIIDDKKRYPDSKIS